MEVRKIQGMDHQQLEGLVQSFPDWNSKKLKEELEMGNNLALFEAEQLCSLIFYRDQPAAFEVIFLLTDPRKSRKGYMRRLLGALIKKAQLQMKEVWLETHENNHSAKALYRSMNFEVTGRRRKYYPDGGAAITYLHR